MAIDRNEVYTDVLVFSDFATVQDVRNRVGDDYGKYIIVVSGGSYAVIQFQDLHEAMTAAGVSPGATLAAIPNFLAEFAVDTLDVHGSASGRDAEKKAALQKNIKAVVILDSQIDGGFNNDNIVGLIMTKKQAGGVRGGATDPSAWIPTAAEAGRLGAEPPMEMAAPADDLEAPATDPRYINVELLDPEEFEKNADPMTKPLTKDKLYKLSFFVDSQVSAFSLGGATELSALAFEAGEDAAKITIQLESDDFEIKNKTQELKVPRRGKSDTVRFDVTPTRDGQCQINAVFLKNGQFLQVMTLKFFVGPLFQVETLGREVDARPFVSRDLNLTILETVGGFQLIMTGPVAAVATIPLSKPQVLHMVDRARKILLDTVFMDAGGVKLYQTRIDIPEQVNKFVLPKLANVGYDLFDELFFGPGHDTQANTLGEKFREMAQRDKLNIRIFSQHFMFPWGILYMGEDPDNPDPEMFLGLKHVIEHIPLQPKMQVTEREIDTSNGFRIGLNVNTDIDQEMGSEIIGRQIKHWQELAQKHNRIGLKVRKDAFDVMEALDTNDDQVMYFYCHAESYNFQDEAKGGPENSKMIFTGRQEIALRQMRKKKNSFDSAPLIFINACESAELSPEFYDGFVPYFVSRGARGVIGTEVETPALFAEEFAYRFFKRFLAGNETLGEIMLSLRREFYQKHHNVMGLLYALYVDGDTLVSEPVVAAEE